MPYFSFRRVRGHGDCPRTAPLERDSTHGSVMTCYTAACLVLWCTLPAGVGTPARRYDGGTFG